MRKIKKNKISIYMVIGIIYTVILLTISTAYSFLNENLSINTTASISQSGEDYTIDNTLVSKEEIDGIYYYEYDVVLTYLGEKTTTGWETYIEIPFDTEIIEYYNAGSCTVEGQVLTITNDTNNGILSPNNTSATFRFKFKTSNADYIFNTLGVTFLYDNTTEPEIPTPEPDTPESADYIDFNFSVLYDWGVSKHYVLNITNNSDTTELESWTATVQIPEDAIVNSLWGAEWSLDEETGIITIIGASWSPSIPPSSSLEINMIINSPSQSETTLIDFMGITPTNQSVYARIGG